MRYEAVCVGSIQSARYIATPMVPPSPAKGLPTPRGVRLKNGLKIANRKGALSRSLDPGTSTFFFSK